MSEDNERKRQEADLTRVKEHVGQLIEHFDSVQILCTRSDPEAGGTVCVSWGAGNWYARYGQARAFCVEREEGLREDFRDQNG